MKTIIILLTLLVSIQFQYPQVKHEMNTSSDESFTIPEVGAYIIQFKNNFKVQFVAPEEVRPAAYKNVDLRKDDIIMMVNGGTIKKVDDIKDAYDKTPVGGDFKLGVKRNNQMFIVTVKKADPKDLPKRKTVIMTEKNMENKVLIAGYGILFTDVNGKPMIDKLLRDDKEEVKKTALKQGDMLTTLNGQEVKTFKQFKSTYENIKDGQDITLKFSNGKAISLKKQEDHGMQIIRKEKK